MRKGERGGGRINRRYNVKMSHAPDFLHPIVIPVRTDGQFKLKDFSGQQGTVLSTYEQPVEIITYRYSN